MNIYGANASTYKVPVTMLKKLVLQLGEQTIAFIIL